MSDKPAAGTPAEGAPTERQHKNDMYGDIRSRSEDDAGVQPPIPAATVVLLRDDEPGIEVLMLKKNSKITFGGMWVFPGGKIDAEDRTGDDDDVAAVNAACRETEEETGLVLDGDVFKYFAHWTPPPGPQKRFTTWFFVADVNAVDHHVEIDDGEIKDHDWLSPAQALARHGKGEIDLVPPTWVTLYHLSQHPTVAAFMAHLEGRPVQRYSTRVVKAADGNRVAMWAGDAGYEAWDAEVSGPRHRLVMASGGFRFENDVLAYD
ncbi:MAG: NUDIX hydrolase [Pseudomonadales bacterium]